MADSTISSTRWGEFKRSAPMTRAFNHLIAGSHFHERFHRWPRHPRDPGATINDFIFSRMIDPRWSALERAFVDKRTAKAEAMKLLPALRAPETLLVVPLDSVCSVDDLFEMLRPFCGANVIAKPAHASGGVTFMRDVISAEDLAYIYHLASMDYTSIMREMQYFALPKTIIVESIVPASSFPPPDYKFHCVDGQPLVCQVDHDRSGTAWSRLFRVPDFQPMDRFDGLVQPLSYNFPAPEQIAELVAAACALAAPFKFVRVDLYDSEDGVYFGELTFTPAASLGIAPSSKGDHAVTATHQVYSQIMMGELLHRTDPPIG